MLVMKEKKGTGFILGHGTDHIGLALSSIFSESKTNVTLHTYIDVMYVQKY